MIDAAGLGAPFSERLIVHVGSRTSSPPCTSPASIAAIGAKIAWTLSSVSIAR